jgi:hypothetical protein
MVLPDKAVLVVKPKVLGGQFNQTKKRQARPDTQS